MATQHASGLVWFRRDLRVHDNTALLAAMRQCERVHCVFVFDTDILEALPRQDRRVEFIRESVRALDERVRELSGHPEGGLIVLHGSAVHGIPALAQELGVQQVYAGRDYEPQALARDQAVHTQLQTQAMSLALFKDHVVFESREILTQSGTPFNVFTPYQRAWLAKLAQAPLTEPPAAQPTRFAPRPARYCQSVPALAALGFETTNLTTLRIPTGEMGGQHMLHEFLDRIDRYDSTRNFPAIKGPSYLGMHLRFGTLSVRQLVRMAYPRHLEGSAGASTWLSELVWRDFYAQILSNYPHVVDASFKPDYDAIDWEQGVDADAAFAAWSCGQTGYPIVDAAMAQLQQTGYMHNRLRMVAGSFLVKHLGIDWRRGEQHFAQMLNDFDLSANNGGWQWVSSSGCDAQPYFRIFNPITQSEKFDAEGKFIKRYLPQLAGLSAKAIHAPWLAKPQELSAAGLVLGQNYPLPIVDHAQARARTLLRYGVVKKAG